jgi:FlaA1/EpsC-like NDP-sugar epimerase
MFRAVHGSLGRIPEEEPPEVSGSTGLLMGRRIRLHGATFLMDALVIIMAYVAADAMRFDGQIPGQYTYRLALTLPFIILIYWASSYLFGLHRRVWKYAGMNDLRAVIYSTAVSFILIFFLDVALRHDHFCPLSVVMIGAIFTFCGLVAVRVGPLMLRSGIASAGDSGRVLIVGAGQAGHLVVRDLLSRPQSRERVIGYVDDDARLHGMRIHGVPVLGRTNDLPYIVNRYSIDIIAIAIPSASIRELDHILELSQATDARIQILPSQAEVLSGRSSALRLRDIDLDSLLDRIPSTEVLQGDAIRSSVRDRVVLVTGGAGSIGSELCRQLVTLGPAKVIALDNNETGLFHLMNELATGPGEELLIPVLASITDDGKLGRVFKRYRPDIVFHAAAYKHVPMLEEHADEAVAVNVVGTLNVCRWVVRSRCQRFVFISTDKAVHPVNALGYSKRIGELLTRAYQHAGPIFCSVRFGNVIGSRGSALPEFVRQIDAGGPVTVTHPDAQRFFMTIPEAVSLVIQAATLAKGGELFMLDMGEPIKIGDLVKRLIRWRGLRVGKDIEVIYTGLRPGEKLTEELVFDVEGTKATAIPSVRVVQDTTVPNLNDLEGSIAVLAQLASDGEEEILSSTLESAALEYSVRGRRSLQSVS